MKKTRIFSALMILGFAISASASDKFKLIGTSQLSKMLAAKDAKTHVYDANNAETRSKYGSIPGAQLLSSSKDYALTELPADKNAALVFYCADTKCMASHKAAERAVTAQYTNVAVFSDGIIGWKKAGHPTTTN